MTRTRDRGAGGRQTVGSLLRSLPLSGKLRVLQLLASRQNGPVGPHITPTTTQLPSTSAGVGQSRQQTQSARIPARRAAGFRHANHTITDKLYIFPVLVLKLNIYFNILIYFLFIQSLLLPPQ